MTTHPSPSLSSPFTLLTRRIAPLAGIVTLLALALSALAGCNSGSTSIASGGTLVFGAAVSTTGSTSHEGTDTLNGYNLWADTVNANGGIIVGGKSYQVSIKSYDDTSNGDTSKQLTTKLITSDHVNFLFGPYGTTPTLADETVAAQYKIPMVEGNGASASIFSANNSYIFGVLSLAPKYGQTMIDAAASVTNGPKTIAIINADDTFSAQVASAAKDYAPTKGFTVVKTIPYKNGATDLSSVVTQLKTASSGHAPDFVLGSGHEAEAIHTLQSAASLGFKPKLWGFTVGPALPDFITSLTTTANGVLSSSQWTAQVKYQGTGLWKTAQDFEGAYKAKYNNVEPSYQAASAAACGVAYQAALQNANSTDAQKVRDALAALDITTFYGEIKFAADGSNQTKPMVTTQIQNGVLVTVFPSNVANGTIQYPGQA